MRSTTSPVRRIVRDDAVLARHSERLCRVPSASSRCTRCDGGSAARMGRAKVTAVATASGKRRARTAAPCGHSACSRGLGGGLLSEPGGLRPPQGAGWPDRQLRFRRRCSGVPGQGRLRRCQGGCCRLDAVRRREVGALRHYRQCHRTGHLDPHVRQDPCVDERRATRWAWHQMAKAVPFGGR